MFEFLRRRAPRDRAEPQFLAASPENPATSLASPSDWLYGWATGGMPGTFGPAVSEKTSMASSAVYRCTALTSGLRASLPLKIYRGTPEDREEAPIHDLQSMFQVAPLPGHPMTAFTWREGWGVHESLWGDHFSAIRYNGAGKIVGFESALPWSEVYRVNGRNLYRLVFVADNGAERYEYLDQDDVIHIPGLGFNGVRGMSRIRFNARNSVALNLMLLEQIGRVHENSARPSMFVPVPPKLSPEGMERFKAQFNEVARGRTNAGVPLFGDKDYQPHPFQMTPEDLNTIELMRFSVADISRFWGVPLHLLNETDKATSWGSGLSEQTLAFLIYTMEPDLGRAEAELNYKLFAGTGYFIEYNRDGLLAMDPVKAAEIARAEISFAGLLPNEYRKKKNRPAIEYGDKPLVNSTNVPLEKLYEPGAQPRQDPIQADPLAPKPAVGAPMEGGGQAGASTNASADLHGMTLNVSVDARTVTKSRRRGTMVRQADGSLTLELDEESET